MKFRKRILWGIILLMLTAGLFLSVFFPEISPFYGIAVWKWFLGAVLLYWFIDHAVFGKSLCEHFDVFLPLGLGFMLFKSDIRRLSGVDFDLVNNWAVLGISVLLTVVVHLLFGSKRNIHVHFSNDSDATAQTRNQSKVKSSFSQKAIYFDLSDDTSFSASNCMGETTVFFQNSELGDQSQPVRLDLSNSFGAMTVHVPADWKITSYMSTEFGETYLRPNPTSFKRELFVYGSNQFGETKIIS